MIATSSPGVILLEVILLVILSILYDPYNPLDPSAEALVSVGRQRSYQDRDIYRGLMSTLM
jgi:hypothetical protein